MSTGIAGSHVARAVIWLLLCSLGALAPDAARAQDQAYVVVYKERGANPVSASGVDRETDARERRLGFHSGHRYESALRGFGARLSADDVKRLEHDPEIKDVRKDVRLRGLGTVPLAAGENVPSGVTRIGAMRAGSVYEASSTSVAVVDTGVDLGHPDLNVASGTNCMGSGSAQDGEGHGTEVAGVIGARNDGSGVVGVAPGTRIYAVKVLDSNGEGSLSDILCGIDWVTANTGLLHIGVANLSLGCDALGPDCPSDPMHQAIQSSTNAGVLYTVAASNDSRSFAYPPEVPAVFPEVLTVTAMSDTDGAPGGTGGSPSCVDPGDFDDYRASFSNFAVTAADAAHTVAAPGTCILSTWRNHAYMIDSGTSFASPYAAGVAALCLGQGGTTGPCSGLSPPAMIQKLTSDAAAFATADNGFVGDPNHPLGPYYGYLVSAEQSTKPLPPPPLPPPAAAVPAKRKLRGCVVPKLRRRTVRRARTKLKRAGCRYRFTGHGRRVRSTKPRAGKRTTKRVVVRLTRVRKKRR